MITIIVRPTLTNEKALHFSGDDPEVFGQCVQSLKAAIPSYLRRFDPRSKHWYVKPDAYGELENFLSDMYVDFAAQVRREDRRESHSRPRPDWASGEKDWAPPPPPRAQANDPYAALHLLPSAPMVLVKTAFKCLSRQLHPDAGGSHEEMVRLNAAYEQLTRRGKAA
jgi:hypothetical protein